jgi:CO dehydrogenase/acetyl-CoA synthase delta subunit
MHSGDAQEVSASDVVLDCSTAATLDVAMKQLAQAAVEHQHQIVTANEDDNEEQQV